MMKASVILLSCWRHECYDSDMATSLDQSDFIKTALRLPRELHAWLTEFANAQGISLNSAIVQILEERRATVPSMNLTEDALDAIESRMRQAMKHK